MSIIGDNITQELQLISKEALESTAVPAINTNDTKVSATVNKPNSTFIYYLVERWHIVTSYFDNLANSYNPRNLVDTAGTDEVNLYCCIAVSVFFPETLIDIVGTVACFVPAMFLDICQSCNQNVESHNMAMLETKLLNAGNEVVISDEFNIDQILEIQYRKGTLAQFVFNRKYYHHPPQGNLVDNDARRKNGKIESFHSSQLKGKIIDFIDGGNVKVRFLVDDLQYDIAVSPLIIERTDYSEEEMKIYSENKQQIRLGEWIVPFQEAKKSEPITFEAPISLDSFSYQANPEKLIPCLACAGMVISFFCYYPSCIGCNLTGDICMLRNVCTCLKVSRSDSKLCICCNANISCVWPKSICALLYQCFCFDCRFKCPPCVDVGDKNNERDFPCICSIFGITCCYQLHAVGPYFFKTIGFIREKGA